MGQGITKRREQQRRSEGEVERGKWEWEWELAYSLVGDWFAGRGPAGILCSLIMCTRCNGQRANHASVGRDMA